MTFGGPALGMLAPGAAADIIFVDYHPYTPLTADNLPWHIVFGFHESMVTTTIASGQVLMRDRKLTMLDEAKIAAEAGSAPRGCGNDIARQAREAASGWHKSAGKRTGINSQALGLSISHSNDYGDTNRTR
jgi:cytosine/adenosine deaminase-related metal-dependent hydrolase